MEHTPIQFAPLPKIEPAPDVKFSQPEPIQFAKPVIVPAPDVKFNEPKPIKFANSQETLAAIKRGQK